jgi:hypothetical protein
MATITVKVEYRRSPGGQIEVLVKPRVARVNQGDEVQFTREDTTPGSMRITFDEKRFFSKPSLDGDGSIAVVAKLSGRTTYKCELFDNAGKLLAVAEGKAGGAFEPGG